MIEILKETIENEIKKMENKITFSKMLIFKEIYESQLITLKWVLSEINKIQEATKC